MLIWKQHAGVKPWTARTGKGEYTVNAYVGKWGPRFMAWFCVGKEPPIDVSGMHGDIEYVKAQAEKHADSQAAGIS